MDDSRRRAGITSEDDRHPVGDPGRRVPGEQQVGQWGDGEVVRLVHAPYQRRTLAAGSSSNVMPAVSTVASWTARACTGARAARRPGRCRACVRRRRAARPRCGRAGIGQRVDQQVDQQQHLDPATAQHLGERVVLVLRAVHPGDAVEQQLVVVARGESLEFRAGPVQQHRAQRADLAVHGHEKQANASRHVSCVVRPRFRSISRCSKKATNDRFVNQRCVSTQEGEFARQQRVADEGDHVQDRVRDAPSATAGWSSATPARTPGPARCCR